MRWTLSIVPRGDDQNVYLVAHDDFGRIGRVYREADVEAADLETTNTDLMSGQFHNPVRVVAFNSAERWADDASEDVAREIMRRFDLAWRRIAVVHLRDSSERHLGPERQLTLRRA
jgi:hypothetical protein